MEELTIKAAAEYYGKSESWIRKRILSGELEAEKRPFQYGERWITTEKALDDLAERLNEQAKMQKDSVNIREVSKPIGKEQFINELIEATESKNKEMIDDALNKVSEQFKQQNKQLQQQNELINKLYEKLDRVEKKQDKSLFDKIKHFFK
ncbi:MAG: hypothetical protein BHK79_07880 [Halanaerobium sp. MDAL1]|jgi:glycine cleavage system protein P-like pyridoxal-binding family|nr:MAG: hypothetical protein BHK79_07880 [Halanaerobium sp. MDAL1]